ncbi:hypothetical protein, partial [Gemmatimonas sp.]|uniref:hypothetical protein n=1 Tax=Gemmatimonas sp. TaxID=1962908 RepID=UPI0039831B6F
EEQQTKVMMESGIAPTDGGAPNHHSWGGGASVLHGPARHREISSAEPTTTQRCAFPLRSKVRPN